eukprot:6447544-Amphidinium_carterae.1
MEAPPTQSHIWNRKVVATFSSAVRVCRLLLMRIEQHRVQSRRLRIVPLSSPARNGHSENYTVRHGVMNHMCRSGPTSSSSLDGVALSELAKL